MHVKYLIIGAGPTGLGAAHRLRELGEQSFAVLEREGHPGGLAASFRDTQGFTWDFGGHVLFSHYDYFDRLTDELLDGEYYEHERESWVRVAGTWVPYPFQNNIRHLPPALRWKCVQGLLPGNRPEPGPGVRPADFGQWIDTVFGPGIAEVFMRPYNYKVWATPPERMGYSWIGERVSLVALEKVLENILLEQDDVAWGPNNTFRFPKKGGTGAIFQALARRVEKHVQYGQAVTRVFAREHRAVTDQGLELEYDVLLNTGPLDLLVRRWLDRPDADMVEAAAQLAHNSVHVTGLGVDGLGTDPRHMGEDTRCWMYFPDTQIPFYRMTNFHHYSPQNTAHPGSQRALMCETATSEHKKEDLDSLSERVVRGLQRADLLDRGEKKRIVSRFEISREYGYPVPTLERDNALETIQPRLESLDIYSRGRFGGWKYEVGNMDHSVMQGVEWAQRMLEERKETTYTLSS
ncbi:Protoporphyrinogen oxidase [Paucidesulfovibrio gracilis DSM 16080]|uniref:Protoporphyrinogen oxidase n=1 Tax=Paucidesulfovibrio gracilis DSM 16080 TaxID=1121449 RepID=A0A1T4XPW1_9BACT|nr:FAD-dependent oxidoreductase [Paucidesulfovibrio gracilis]SKA91599.1 Protoporphyrinogen oxidase [Paucidesulfovibrio gracilis DSM 16080]